MATILMCPPDHYAVEYEINPWMDLASPVDQALAAQQWRGLVGLLEGAGAEVLRMPPVAGLPDLVFTANAALVYRGRAIVARFRHPEREGESEHNRRWLADHGLEVLQPPGDAPFEGAGDALFVGDTLFAGYRTRSDAGSLQEIGRGLGVQVLPLELVTPEYYHLDTCFCPLTPEAAVWFPGAFDGYGQRVIRAEVPKLIEVEPAEAAAFACNSVVVGHQVFSNEGCPRMQEALAAAGFEPTATPLGEFLKAGGSAKCLTLRLDGEDAAVW